MIVIKTILLLFQGLLKGFHLNLIFSHLQYSYNIVNNIATIKLNCYNIVKQFKLLNSCYSHTDNHSLIIYKSSVILGYLFPKFNLFGQAWMYNAWKAACVHV